MKFLILSKLIAGVPPPEDAAAFFKASQEYLDALLADGSLDCVYITPNGGGAAIANVVSHEELWEKTNAFPGAPYLKYEFYPLLDHTHFYSQLIGEADRAKQWGAV